MTDPIIFISHKHDDTKIAQVIANFLEQRSNGSVKVYLSSSPEFMGPKFGKALNTQLRTALWNAEALILLYTSADKDWQYCMYECGVATLEGKETAIIVFQCGTEAPAPFDDVLRVNPRKIDDLTKFTDQFLRDKDFFPGRNAALAPNLKDKYIQDAAKDFYETLLMLLPSDDGLIEEWTTWPFVKVELPISEINKTKDGDETNRLAFVREKVKTFGQIIETSPHAAQMFGQAVLPNKFNFEVLLKAWQDKYPGLETTWFDSCCEQILMAAERGFPIIRWAPAKEVGGNIEFTPVLSRIRKVPFAGTIQFDIYFYNLSDPQGVPVTSKMLSLNDFFYKDLGKIEPQNVKLRDLITELEKNKKNRLPIISPQGYPMYIIHRSMIDKFISGQFLKGSNPEGLTLADLLADAEMKQMFENTFCLVNRNATLSEAKAAMIAKPGCSDVFVTNTGNASESIQGWLTNVDIER